MTNHPWLQMLRVVTGSMEPTIPIRSRIVVDTMYFSQRAVERFDIVAAERVDTYVNRVSPVHETVVARVVGLPGERVALAAGSLVIDGRVVNEPYRTASYDTASSVRELAGEMGEVSIPAGQYFLLADNRGCSVDSRLWVPKCVAREQVLGKVTGILPASPPN